MDSESMDSTDREFSGSTTVTEIGRWLETKGIPEEYCRKCVGKHGNLGCVTMTKAMAWYLHMQLVWWVLFLLLLVLVPWFSHYCSNSVGCFNRS